MEIVIRESRDVDKVIKLYEQHKDIPFTYLMNIPLVKMLSRLDSFKIFVAETDEIVGCIHALNYVYDCGYIGGLLVHKDFRRMGIGSKLLNTALRTLNARHVYLFVEEKNTVAISLFKKMGFRKIYRRLFYTVSSQLNDSERDLQITSDVEWNDLKGAIGFLERNGIVNFGYYPIKMTRSVFEDLKANGKIFRCGSVIAVVENLYRLMIGDHLYTFNDYIVKHLQNVDLSRKIIEVNPFYIGSKPSDLVSLINHLLTLGEVHIKTYDGDPVASKLPLTSRTGALTMEYGSTSPVS